MEVGSRVRMAGASFAQIACPTFTRHERYGRFQTFLGGADRFGERLLKGFTGLDRMLVGLGRRLKASTIVLSPMAALPRQDDSRQAFLQ